VTYELQPPSTTTLKLITGPETGGDTLWSSGYALYSSLSPSFQAHLEGLSAVHSAVAQATGARAAGLPVRREPVETTHPVVRVHPATGWKSVYVNPGTCNPVTRTRSVRVVSHVRPRTGFTTRIVGVPKAESDAILAFLFTQIAQNPTSHVRYKWEPNDVAIWDNRVSPYLFIYSCRRPQTERKPHTHRS
jgi:sulfonate dioxygenase